MAVKIATINTSGFMRGLEDRRQHSKRLEIIIPTFHSLVHKGYRNEVKPKGPNNRQIVTLQFFVESLLAGKYWAIEALHAIPAAIVESTPIWDHLVANRHHFYFEFFESTAFIARSIKDYATAEGPTHSALLDIANKLETARKAGALTLKEAADTIGDVDYSPYIVTEHKHPPGEPKDYGISLDGKWLHGGLPIESVTNRIHHLVNTKTDVIPRIPNWKILATNLRLCHELTLILKNNEFTYPLPADVNLEITLTRMGSCSLEAVLDTLGTKLLWINRQLAKTESLKPADLGLWLSWVTQQYRSNL